MKASGRKATRNAQRRSDLLQRKLHVPLINRNEAVGDPAPYVVVVQGPPGVGKSTLIKSLVRKYTKYTLPEVKVCTRDPVALACQRRRASAGPHHCGSRKIAPLDVYRVPSRTQRHDRCCKGSC